MARTPSGSAVRRDVWASWVGATTSTVTARVVAVVLAAALLVNLSVAVGAVGRSLAVDAVTLVSIAAAAVKWPQPSGWWRLGGFVAGLAVGFAIFAVAGVGDDCRSVGAALLEMRTRAFAPAEAMSCTTEVYTARAVALLGLVVGEAVGAYRTAGRLRRIADTGGPPPM